MITPIRRRPDAPPPKSAETMSPERRLRAGIKLAHHHALWLGVVDYRNDPLDQKLVDHVLAHVRERVDDYFAAPKKLPAPPPNSAEPASGKVIERVLTRPCSYADCGRKLRGSRD